MNQPAARLNFNSLANACPALAHLPRAGLIRGATPLQMLPNAEPIYIKRDELSAADYAGNKIRKHDFLLADALAPGRPALTVFGYAASHFVAARARSVSPTGLRPAE